MSCDETEKGKSPDRDTRDDGSENPVCFRKAGGPEGIEAGHVRDKRRQGGAGYKQNRQNKVRPARPHKQGRYGKAGRDAD
jgi:hypothetical protein